jgi:SAM-dependent methyltransferase
LPSEFDRYARDYKELLRDPIRDRFAPSGDFFHRRKAILIAEFLRRQAFPAAISSWLDVGCGKGELLVLARHLFGRAAGCDPSEEMGRSAGVEIYHQNSLVTLPAPDQGFDFVTAVCVYHHVEEQDRGPLTREIYRVLKVGGVFCMIEHNPFNPVTQTIVRKTPVDANARLLSASRAERYQRESGFQPVGREYFLYLPERWYDKAKFFENLLSRVPLGGQYAVFGKKPHPAA